MPDFHTGRYAAFIWPAYGLTVLVVGWMIAATLIRARRWKALAEKGGPEKGGAGKKREEP